MLIGGHELLTVEVLTGSEPEPRRRPVVVIEPVVGVRASAEPGVVVRCDQERMPQRRLVRGARRPQQFGRTRDHRRGTAERLRGHRGQVQARRRRWTMQYLGRVLVRPARQR